MESISTVCCMCGDVGFQDRLFQCMRCHYRSQHSYCSNYYDDIQSTTSSICDWCLSEQRNTHATNTNKTTTATTTTTHLIISKKQQAHHDHKDLSRSEYSSMDKIKQTSDHEEVANRPGKTTTTGASSSKPSGRRYKLLKDVLC
ncbi:putative chromatin regulator PHD family [Dioscorea sansibarensis]